MASRICSRLSASVFLVLSITFGCKKGDDGAPKSTTSEINTTTVTKSDTLEKSPAKGTPDFTMEVTQWAEEFQKGKEAAAAKYKDKLIELSGIVSDTGEDPYGNVGYIYLQVPKSVKIDIRCGTKDTKPWLKVSEGSKIKIRGTPDLFGEGGLYPAEVVEAGPSPAFVVSAVQLAEEFAKNPESASKKYHRKWAHIEGEVNLATRKEGEKPIHLLFLKGDATRVVKCFIMEGSGKQLADVQPGAKLKVYGQLTDFGIGEKEIDVYYCVLSELK
jgi:tRNA_anti-like